MHRRSEAAKDYQSLVRASAAVHRCLTLGVRKPVVTVEGGSRVAGTDLFDLADRRLAWLDRRQQVLAQNIANADTPGFRARDLKPFAASLSMAGVAPARTDPAHLSGRHDDKAGTVLGNGAGAIDGNNVRLEEQLGKIASTDLAQNTATSLYKKFMGLYRIAAGR